VNKVLYLRVSGRTKFKCRLFYKLNLTKREQTDGISIATNIAADAVRR